MAFADSRLDISGLGQLAAAIGAIPASEGKRSMLRLQTVARPRVTSRNETQTVPTCCDIRPARTLLTLNWQFIDDHGGLVYRLMCRIARDRHDGSHCANHAHRHGD